jgi:hypothetical protein
MGGLQTAAARQADRVQSHGATACRRLTIGDLSAIAKRRVPRGVFEYTDGAAESEISLRRARQLFRDVQFNPSVSSTPAT